ncbi:MAG: hybrid sensor histidine kinase/response regulator [Bdellovibrionota bacterium]
MTIASGAAVAVSSRPYNIAVVDDEEMVTFAINKALRHNPTYKIHTFNSPLDAAKAIEAMDLDLIISDYLMPHMTGVELLLRIKESKPDATRIMLTAYADKESVIKAINDVGLFFYLEKPWENEDLRLVVQRGLEKRDLVSQLRQRVVELETANKELKEAREELIRSERLSAIGQMASSIVHDFKGPMTAILGFSELLALPDYTTEEKQSLYHSIRTEIERMVDMTNEVLDFTKGTISLQREEVPLKDFLEHTVKPLERALTRNKVEVRFAHGAPERLSIDRRRFRRVMENLVGNAIDAMLEGGSIEISSQDQGDAVLIDVKDTGSGIPPQIRETLFLPFVTHGKSHGTGLGMAIAKRIVESHGGSISFDTEMGKGTVFHLCIPKK